MAAPDHNGDERPSRLGYIAAIVVSALGHAALFGFVFFVAPRYLHPEEAAPPSYTVKIVDNLPAGDLGTHLPRINRHQQEPQKAEPPKEQASKVKTEPPKIDLAANDDKNAFAIKAATPAETAVPTATPTPEPTPERTVEATVEPTVAPTVVPTAHPHPTPAHAKHSPAAKITVAAKPKAIATPNAKERLALLRQKLFEKHVKEIAAKAKAAAANSDDSDDSDDSGPTEMADNPPAGGGPVVGPAPSEGSGFGIGSGTGSAGILQDPEFLLYYKTVQDQIKKAWASMGGSSDLTATVDFAINPDGSLAYVKIAQSSKDSAFDDSVVRAIRRAAPFPAPPDKFQDRFSAGVQAVFELGELKS